FITYRQNQKNPVLHIDVSNDLIWRVFKSQKTLGCPGQPLLLEPLSLHEVLQVIHDHRCWTLTETVEVLQDVSMKPNRPLHGLRASATRGEVQALLHIGKRHGAGLLVRCSSGHSCTGRPEYLQLRNDLLKLLGAHD